MSATQWCEQGHLARPESKFLQAEFISCLDCPGRDLSLGNRVQADYRRDAEITLAREDIRKSTPIKSAQYEKKAGRSGPSHGCIRIGLLFGSGYSSVKSCTLKLCNRSA